MKKIFKCGVALFVWGLILLAFSIYSLFREEFWLIWVILIADLLTILVLVWWLVIIQKRGKAETENVSIDEIQVGDIVVATHKMVFPLKPPNEPDENLVINPNDKGVVSEVSRETWSIGVKWTTYPYRTFYLHYMPTYRRGGWWIKRVK